MRLKFLKLLLTGFITVFISISVYCQEGSKEKTDPNIEFICSKNNDDSRSLIINLGISRNREITPVKNAVIDFFTGNNFEINLGSAVTNRKGKAVCIVPANFNLPVNGEGKFSFKAVFSGNDSLNNGEQELQLKNLKMELTFNDNDSIKNITISAWEQKINGMKVPFISQSVNIYVPRMFSMLKIAEAKLDSSGTAVVDFPPDVPGDSIGNLKIIAKVEDNSDYGNVEKYKIKKWGKPASRKYLLIHRALWTAVAPIWMIITLTIMLVGVWAHYLYVIFRIILIGRTGKKSEEIKVY